jgi:hypothetical protein
MNKISKNVYLFVIAILSVALCVSVTLNFTGKTEASAKKAAAERRAMADIIADINSDFYGSIFVGASHNDGTLSFTLRKDIGGGIFVSKFIIIQNVDLEDISTE